MGNNTVAVLYNDMHRELAEAMPRLGWAMRHFGFGGRSRAKEEAHFGCGQIISCDHASGYQVVVVHGNTGWRVGADEEIRPDVIRALCDAIDRSGWKKVRGKWVAPDALPSSPHIMEKK